MKFCASVLLVSLFYHTATAQQNVTWPSPSPRGYGFVHASENRFTTSGSLNPFLEKLYQLKKGNGQVVRIVHIGDSHLQADMITSVLRDGFRSYFGNAGRGISFPYQLAKSNAPRDISSSSNVTWQYNRLAHPEISIVNGLSGFGIHTTQAGAEIRFALRTGEDSIAETFDVVKLFTGSGNDCYTLRVPGAETLLNATTRPGTDTPSATFTLMQPTSSFILSKCTGRTSSEFDFYGLSMEKKNTSGVIYHTIGVNGAQYQQYTNTPLFWRQLPALQADCYIISLGTNEAQRLGLTEEVFMAEVDSFITKLKAISPQAVIILTTPAGSYYQKKKPNPIIKTVAQALEHYCAANKIACWDLYRMTGGVAGTLNWKRNGLMSHDLVHYSQPGYQLQGELMLEAFTHAYNEHVKKRRENKEVIIKTGGK